MSIFILCIRRASEYFNPYALSLIISIMLGLFVLLVGTLSEILIRGEYRIISSVLGGGFAMFFINYLTFPGTVLHEWSHAIFGVLTGAKITKVKIFEKPSSKRLGHVEFVPRGFFLIKAVQLSFISSAPAITGMVLAYILIYMLLNIPMERWTRVLIVYFLLSVINHSQMSGADIKNYLKGFIFILPFVFFIVYAVLHFAFRLF